MKQCLAECLLDAQLADLVWLAGTGDVIKGWDLGIEGMHVGDRRKLTIPPQLAYGSAGAGKAIPGNSTLEFDVTLQKIR